MSIMRGSWVSYLARITRISTRNSTALKVRTECGWGLFPRHRGPLKGGKSPYRFLFEVKTVFNIWLKNVYKDAWNTLSYRDATLQEFHSEHSVVTWLRRCCSRKKNPENIRTSRNFQARSVVKTISSPRARPVQFIISQFTAHSKINENRSGWARPDSISAKKKIWYF